MADSRLHLQHRPILDPLNRDAIVCVRVEKRAVTNAQRREANQKRRELAAFKQQPLPLGDDSDPEYRDTQRSRRLKNLAEKLECYPKPPVNDHFAAVRGNPRYKGTPQPVFITPRFKSGVLWFTPPVACR